MERLSDPSIICCFAKENTKNGKALYITQGEASLKDSPDFLVRSYEEPFEQLLNFSIPTKNRRPKQLLPLLEVEELIQQIPFGVLSFTYEEIPYSVGLNHIYMDGTFYFHGAPIGFKLHSTHVPVSYLMIQDLGINEQKRTHNHTSIFVQGTMTIVEETAIKQQVMQQLMTHLTPENQQEISEKLLERVAVLALEPKFMIGKRHIR